MSPHINVPLLFFPRSLKAVLMGKPQDNTVDLSGIPLTLKDLDRVTSYLQHSSEHIDTVELCFTELTDDMLLQLLPALCVLPHLTTLSLNGNRLTKAILRDLTETLKDPKKFPSVTWIDLGNNVDIFSLPQPFLVSLKRRCPKQGNLPTILEFGEGQVSDLESQDGLAESQEDLRVGPGKTDNKGLQQTDRTVEAAELPNSEQGAAALQTWCQVPWLLGGRVKQGWLKTKTSALEVLVEGRFTQWDALGVWLLPSSHTMNVNFFSFRRTHKGDRVEYLHFIKAGQVFWNISDMLCFLNSQKCVSKLV